MGRAGIEPAALGNIPFFSEVPGITDRELRSLLTPATGAGASGCPLPGASRRRRRTRSRGFC
jgi:hypothetical protein